MKVGYAKVKYLDRTNMLLTKIVAQYRKKVMH